MAQDAALTVRVMRKSRRPDAAGAPHGPKPMMTNELPRDKRTDRTNRIMTDGGAVATESRYGSEGYEIESVEDFPAFVGTVEAACERFDEPVYRRARQLEIDADLSPTEIGIALGLLAEVDDAAVAIEAWSSKGNCTQWFIDPDGGVEA